MRGSEPCGCGRADIVHGVVADVHDLVGLGIDCSDEAGEERGVRLAYAPLTRSGDVVGGQVETAQQVADLRGLISGDHDLQAGGAQGGERGPDIGVQVGLVKLFALPGGFPGFVLGGEVDPGTQ
ncbi:hypothetical protein N566_13740 [Streptomycetaceae bacterium MP113-05]|nr:hypothetical protein N566_13740 [Streptomycetaceae bacterium MP113-05]